MGVYSELFGRRRSLWREKECGWNAFPAAMLFFLTAPIAMRDEDFWTKKSYPNWSADDRQRI